METNKLEIFSSFSFDIFPNAVINDFSYIANLSIAKSRVANCAVRLVTRKTNCSAESRTVSVDREQPHLNFF